MSHYTLTVALSGDVAPEDLRSALEAAMAPFNENLDVPLHRDTSVYAESYADQLAKARASNRDNWTEGLTDDEIAAKWSDTEAFDVDGWPMTTRNPDGHWDWWVIGGRWGGAWHLKEGAQAGPLGTDDHSFGSAERAGEPGRVDNARWRDIVPESVEVTYAWLDLDGEWNTKWLGPTREEAIGGIDYSNTDHWQVPQEEHSAKFMKFLANLPGDTWLVHIDFHN